MENLEKQIKKLLESMEEGCTYEISIIKKPISNLEETQREKDIVKETNWYKVLNNLGENGFVDMIKFYDKKTLVDLAKKVSVDKPSLKEDKVELITRIVNQMKKTLNAGRSFR